MTKFLFLIGFITLQLSATGQIVDNTYKRDLSNIYNQSFYQYFKYLEREKSEIPDSLLIEKDYNLTDSLLAKVGKTKLIVLETSDLGKLLKKYKSIVLYKFFPIELKNKEFYVSFVPFIVSYNKKESTFLYENPGSFWVIFNYVNNRFEFKRIKENGI